MNIKKKNYSLSPLSYFTVFYLLQVGFIPLVFINVVQSIFANFRIDTTYYLYTFQISILFFLSVIVGWYLVLHFRLGQMNVNKILRFLSIGRSGLKFGKSYLRFLSFAFLLCFLISFAILAQVSGAGTLWLTDSRTAYQFYRKGVGIFYAITTSFLTLSFLFSIFNCSHKKNAGMRSAILKIIPKVLFFMIIAYFLGSKGTILGIMTIALVYCNYNIVVIPLWFLSACAVGMLLMIFMIQFIQGTASSFTDTIAYADYFHNTSEFLRRFNEFELQYGKVFLSNFWAYVPRIIYPDKPFEYGQLLINQVLFPGAAERTATPGLLGWAAMYLDLGIVGVCLAGLSKGLCLGWAHNFYLENKPGVINFIILLHLGGFHIVISFLPSAAFFLLFLPCFSLVILLIKSLVCGSKKKSILTTNLIV